MVSDSLSVNEPVNERGENALASPNRYEDAFWQRFPYYLSIGMSEEQYWDGDATLVKYYRKAQEIRTERDNQQAWLQGMYVYDALSRLSPILHAFAKKGTKALPYVEEPYPITEKRAEQVKQDKEMKQSQKGLAYMKNLTAANNKKFNERK